VEVRAIPVGPLAENAYLAWEGGRGVLIDPGAEPETLEAALGEAGFTPEAILLTHAHFDHVGAVAPLAEAHGLPVYLHAADLDLYRRAPEIARAYGLDLPPPPEPAGFLDEGDQAFGFRVLHLPGHSPGHLAFYRPEDGLIFVGDVLFRGAVGRYDLPGADREALLRSLARLAALPDATRVFPGHGEPTTIGREKRTNPFLTGGLP